MARFLKVAAAVFFVAALAIIAWSVSLQGYGLSFLPEAQTSFDLKPLIIEGILSIGLLVAGVTCIAFVLLALAGIIERLDLTRRQRSGPARKAAFRATVSARTMRIAAVVIVVVAVAALQLLPSILVVGSDQMFHDTYLVVGGIGASVGPMLFASAIAFVMVGLAAILERLDQIRGQSNDDD